MTKNLVTYFLFFHEKTKVQPKRTRNGAKIPEDNAKTHQNARWWEAEAAPVPCPLPLPHACRGHTNN